MTEREYYRRRDKRLSHDLDERVEPENLVKSYPSLPYGTECNMPIVAFDKLDGSNIRAEWTVKKGFHKFGTRNRLVDASDPLFGRAPELVQDKYGQSLSRTLLHAGYERAMCFFEFWGPKSFAGMHDVSDDLTVTLFDIAPFKQGILEPEAYLKLVNNTDHGPLDHARVLYTGQCTPEFIEQVRSGTLPGMTFEGVVCKAKNDKKTKAPIMFKQKSSAWLDRLHAYCGENKDLFNALR
jgi:hypothetical protein